MTLQEIYDFLKQYIDEKTKLGRDVLEQLFTDYKTKEVGSNINDVKTVADSITNVNTVSSNIDNVNITGTNINSVNTTASNIDNVNITSTNINSINTTATNIESVNNVSDSIDNVNNVSNNIDVVNQVANNLPNVITVGSNIENVNITANSIDDVNTYAKTYLGPKDTDPTTRNDGSDLQVGDLYFNTTINKMKVYDGSQWQLASSAVNGLYKRASFIGDGSTTTFAVTGGFDANYGIVFLNGVDVTKDVDISDGQNIKFNTAPNDGDEISAYFFGSFQVADAVLATGDSTTIGDIIFDDKNKGIILKDRTKVDADGNPIKWRVYIDNGNITLEEV